ncbi:MAG TPA: FIVAR domain-containing protein [Firmicutes bacterium]|nr:FIVAR domain-containing protein [Bacillota bacterium]
MAEESKADGEYDGAIPSVQESFDAALAEAKRVYADPEAGQTAVDSVWQTLLHEVQKLGFQAGDKTMLKKVLDLAGEMQERLEQYVDGEEKEAFLADWETAGKVHDDPDAMEPEITEAIDSLTAAMGRLRYKADKTLLAELVARANQIDASLYTDASVQVLTAALQEADSLLEDEGLSEDDQPLVDSAAAELQAALEQLEEKPADPDDTTDPDDTADPDETSDSEQISDAGRTENADDYKGVSPKTGDSWPVLSVLALTLLSGAGILLLRRVSGGRICQTA